MTAIIDMAKRAKKASKDTAKLSTKEKNDILSALADAIDKNRGYIIEENKKDMQLARSENLKKAMLDRLLLTNDRIDSIIVGIKNVAGLDDPTALFTSMKELENGLLIGERKVPLGVVAMIYEARPNVTADAVALTVKSGNAVILKCGKEAIYSCTAMVEIFQNVLEELEYSPDFVQIIRDTSREATNNLLKQHAFIDVIIPRGGAGLIQTVVENSQIPVIETGVGNCHIFLDDVLDEDKAIEIVLNAKVQRPCVCNSVETVLVHEKLKEVFVKRLIKSLLDSEVEIRGDEKICALDDKIELATEVDWETEYADLIIAIKYVKDLEEALWHIEEYSSQHSEAIITENYTHAQKFLDEVDAAAVYVNASTRFTDGGALGLGAEIGISTQKMHARGPMGLAALTSSKFVIYGDGHIRS